MGIKEPRTTYWPVDGVLEVLSQGEAGGKGVALLRLRGGNQQIKNKVVYAEYEVIGGKGKFFFIETLKLVEVRKGSVICIPRGVIYQDWGDPDEPLEMVCETTPSLPDYRDQVKLVGL